MAIKWMMALVEQPIAMATFRALSTARRSMISAGVRSSQTISTARRPVAEARRIWPASGAGTELPPGRIKPSASVMPVMVEAVPMVMQWP